MKNANKLFLCSVLMLVFMLLFTWIDGSLDKYFTVVGLTCLFFGIGFIATLGGLMAIDIFKGSVLFSEKNLINEAVRLIHKKFSSNTSVTVELNGRRFRIIPEPPEVD